MTNVVKAPIRYHRRSMVRPAEMYAQQEPPDEMVWDMCRYTRRSRDDDMRCMGCPKWEKDTHYGKVQRMCYGLAMEACMIAFAWQKRLGAKAHRR